MKHTAESRALMSAVKRQAAEAKEPQRVAEFWRHVVKTDGCWLWQRPTHGHLYGLFYFRGRNQMAHRVAYMLERGPIPPGLTLDHQCNQPLCVNPYHLEPATLRENVLRGDGPSARNARKTHCKQGHAYTEENTRLEASGRRKCRTCERERSMWRRAHDEKWAAWRNTWRAEHRDELRAYRHAYYLARKQDPATSPDAPVQMAVTS